MKAKNQKFDINENIENGIRINKFLSDAGICSRREADTIIASGDVKIDGVKAELGSRVEKGQVVTYKGKEVNVEKDQVLIAFNKPVGIVCTTETREPDNIIDFINYPKRIYPIGRLDKDSEGLILLTNDGDIVNKILRAGNEHEKEYQVVVNKPLSKDFIEGMQSGVPILDTVTKPCKIVATGNTSFNITITQGLNRQIRRMCEYFDYRVLSLKRIRIMHINLGRLNTGTYRNLTPDELRQLKEVLKESSNLSMKEVKLSAARAESAKLAIEKKEAKRKEKAKYIAQKKGAVRPENKNEKNIDTEKKQSFSKEKKQSFSEDKKQSFSKDAKKGVERRTEKNTGAEKTYSSNRPMNSGKYFDDNKSDNKIKSEDRIKSKDRIKSDGNVKYMRGKKSFSGKKQ